MSSISYSDDMETNLDEVEIDEHGNLRKSQEICSTSSAADPEDLDEMETDLDAVEIDAASVDEDGNLRIHSAEELLSSLTRSSVSEDPSHGPHDNNLTPAEKQSIRKRWNDKQKYAGAGTDEEGIEMEYQRNHNLARPRSQSFCMAVGSTDVMDSPPGPSSGATAHGTDFHDIELSVFRQPSIEEHRPGAADVERGEERKTRQKGLLGVLDVIRSSAQEFYTNLTPTRLAILAALASIVIGIGLLVGLLPASFVYVEYDELALVKNRVTGRVNRKDVYFPGCYLMTPATELIRFQGTAHLVQTNFEVQTSDELTFNLAISLYYFIKPEELGLLFSNYEHNYRDVIEKVIRSTVKNQAGKFSLDHFRLNRTLVAGDFEQAVARRLSGNCCPSCCPNHCGKSVDCRYSCRLLGRCKHGFHMELRHFQMLFLTLPNEVLERFLRQTVLLIEGEKEQFVQDHAVETKVSEMKKNQILNQANEIREVADAEGKKIVAFAEADYEKKVQMTYVQAMKKFYQRLNITQEDHKLSLMYIRALEDISDNLYNLNLEFDQLTSFG